MLRSAWIFLAAILLPSLVLAWLGIRSASDQQVVLEHQQAIISQDVTDRLAKSVGDQIDTLRLEFVQITQDLLAKSAGPQATAVDFDPRLREQWSAADVGFAVDLRGNIYSPGREGNAAARTFHEENDRFLSNRENVEVYSSLKSQNLVAKVFSDANLPGGGDKALDEKVSGSLAPMSAPVASAAPDMAFESATTAAPATPAMAASDSKSATSSLRDSDLLMTKESARLATGAADEQQKQAMQENSRAMKIDTLAPSVPADSSKTATTTPVANSGGQDSISVSRPVAGSLDSLNKDVSPSVARTNQVLRQVSPQNNFNMASAILSNTVPAESDFRRLIGSDTSGALARFLDDKLRVMVWYRPSNTDDMVFGAQLAPAQLLARFRTVLQAPELKEREGGYSSAWPVAGYCLALLDDTGKPAALSIPGFTTDWKHPFVATEIGDTLPHWEAALYLTDPAQLSRSAHTLRLTIGLIVVLLVVAIAAGGSLIAADIRRQVRLAQQKTDFVSNVSHELKTPLTSIRMFADLLAEGRVSEPEKQETYLKIISAESARLTRLINNVLDFARQERGAPDGERRACDLVETARDVVETCLPHLEASGQNLACEIESETLPIIGDRDALAQIILNLISNAEKYGGNDILVRLRRQETSAGPLACVDVLDRGPGIPPRQVESIFLPFHRLHDSLSSGTPGSGLGLTLARRMARVHRGDIAYTPRAGGGSCFTLSLPLTASRP